MDVIGHQAIGIDGTSRRQIFVVVVDRVDLSSEQIQKAFNLASPFMLLLFDVFLLAVDETIEHRPFLGNTEIVLNISDCYVIAFGRDAKENAR